MQHCLTIIECIWENVMHKQTCFEGIQDTGFTHLLLVKLDLSTVVSI